MKKIVFHFLLMLVFFTACQPKKSTTVQSNKTIDSLFVNADYTETFDSIKHGRIPSGWFTAVTGNGTAGQWEIIEDENGKVVGQTSGSGSGYLFNLLITNQPELKDLALSVSFKAIDGKEDQGGGLVWRYQDAENYYIARANPLESNLRVYKVIDGNRKQIESYSLPITAQTWHNLAVINKKNNIQCYYDGQLFIDTKDSTISKAGKAGLWTKADAQTMFDNFSIKK
ncbi:MAG: hypothetical protein PHP53_22075 [Prolixibacteraceae bacterium]|jgi:hypothetical protein|nr:hypothetical protein [Prolixibacteraceae bacterium]